MADETQQLKERKTLDDRAKMTELERIRHSCAHVLATAILRLWPDAQFAAGPPVENGFYYDVDLSHRISPEDFGRIEEEMKKEGLTTDGGPTVSERFASAAKSAAHKTEKKIRDDMGSQTDDQTDRKTP